jgi:hypothetical protein
MGVVGGSTMALVVCAAVFGGGCGSNPDGTGASSGTAAGDLEATFAPLIEIPHNERYRPMGAGWFVARSMLSIEVPGACGDREIAVGRALPHLRTEATDWIFPARLGSRSNRVLPYYRNPYDAECELTLDRIFFADQLTRPFESGPRAEAVPRAEGFQLDLDDRARVGPPFEGDHVSTPVYVERANEGDGRVRLIYRMLFGMHAPNRDPAHEGDWERVDVLLDEVASGRYTPVAVQLGLDGGPIEEHAAREIAWDSVSRVEPSHPRLLSAPGSHTLSYLSSDTSCGECVSWRTWRVLERSKDQSWYGFGGAWGAAGETDATTGPLGPRHYWPDPSAELPGAL